MTFEVGDFIEVQCVDGAVFRGVLMDFADDYVIVNGYGYPLSMVKELRHA